MANPNIHMADAYAPAFGMQWVPVHSRAVLEAMPLEQLIQYRKNRTEYEKLNEANPVRDGYVLPMWNKVMANWPKYKNIILLGGNRSGKSTFCARLSVWASCVIPGAEVHCYSVNNVKSVDEQQKYIWEAIPASIKAMPTKKGQYHTIQYSQRNGFTGDKCIFPPHSGARSGGYMRFHNYAQYGDDPNTAEGFKGHLLWLDEECPLSLFKTLQYRTVDYRGRIVLSFTTIGGWTPLVQLIMAKTKTIEKAYAPLLGRDLPIIQESLSFPDTIIYNFWTEHNAWIDVGDFQKAMRGKPKEEIMARAYGIPTKSIAGVFPSFNKEVNVIAHDELPFVKLKLDDKGEPIPYKVTRYMAIDPAGSKHWFMLWVAIDASDTWFVYAEWPDFDDWALAGSTAAGKPGPAQKGTGKGIRDYVELIKGIESDTRIYERYIDPRLGAAEKQTQDGATTIINDLDEADMTVIPASGVDIENGIQLINNLLAYDEKKPRSSVNSPRLFISDRCQNLIYALQEYTNAGGRDESCKDPIDCLRYLAVSNLQYFEETKGHDQPTGVY